MDAIAHRDRQCRSSPDPAWPETARRAHRHASPTAPPGGANHGRALIDTTYGDDAASAIVAAADRAVPGGEACGGAGVVTGADPRPVNELIGGILRAAGLATSPRSIPSPLAAFAGHLTDHLWPGAEPPLTDVAARQLSVAHWFASAPYRPPTPTRADCLTMAPHRLCQTVTDHESKVDRNPWSALHNLPAAKKPLVERSIDL